MATEICVAAPVYIQTQRYSCSCMDILVCAHIFHFRTKARQHNCVNALLVFLLLFCEIDCCPGGGALHLCAKSQSPLSLHPWSSTHECVITPLGLGSLLSRHTEL